jgi:hypothetical protein
MADPNRFSIPVIEFLATLMREKYPALNVSRGSPFYQAFLRPASTVLQPFRDRNNTIKRNQSLVNYQVMTVQEMDRRTSNFLVDRLLGSRAYGVQRVYYDLPRSVVIDTTAVFLDDSDRRWNPINTVSATEFDLAANAVPESAEYYIDVPVIAEAEGDEYRAEAGQVNRVLNVPGATRTENPSDYSSGRGAETNTELFTRTTESITNKDLVKVPAIVSVIKENFSSVRAVQVVGMGDAKMTRDVVNAIISIDQILRYSFCQKVNLPLDENGEVKWLDDDGNPIISPLGGYVGAVVDLTGIDFNSVTLAAGYDPTVKVSVQPGFRVQLYDGYTGDPDAGEHYVTRVEEVPIAAGGRDTKVCRLDRAFQDPQISSWSPTTDYDKYSYTIFGGVSSRAFHVGGKIDVYVDSLADEEDSVIVNSLPELSPGVSEVPVTATNPINIETNLPLFEDNNPFRLPTLGILKIEQVDYEDASKVERELIPSVNWVYVSAEARGRYTQTEDDVVIIKGFEDDEVTPAFVGKRIKITYITNPDVPLIQDFVDSRANRDVTKDTLVKPKKTAILDTELEFQGDRTEAQVDEIISEYIKNKGFGGTVTAHEIDTLLGLFGITDVTHPIYLRVRRDKGNGITESTVSEDSVTAESDEVFYPASPLSVRKGA